VPGHLEQILDNLIDNALEATPASGTVDLRVSRAAGAVEVHVSDTGRGMSEPDRLRAFDAFWTNGNGSRSSSTGLGLAIAEQLARACHGSLRLDRAPTGGIDAVVEFPSATAPASTT
jgi:signal transduction histidine kinase